jgi:hypothetical protein
VGSYHSAGASETGLLNNTSALAAASRLPVSSQALGRITLNETPLSSLRPLTFLHFGGKRRACVAHAQLDVGGSFPGFDRDQFFVFCNMSELRLALLELQTQMRISRARMAHERAPDGSSIRPF